MCERTHAHTHRLFVVIQSYDVHAVREIAAEHTQFETPCAGSLLLHCDHHSTLVCPELSSSAGYEPIAARVKPLLSKVVLVQEGTGSGRV